MTHPLTEKIFNAVYTWLETIHKSGMTFDQSNSLLRTAIQSVLDGEGSSRWISIDERLPDENTYVLVANHYGVHCMAHRYTVSGWIPYATFAITPDIIAWQPLPDAPIRTDLSQLKEGGV